MYMERPMNLVIRNAKFQFNTNFSGKPYNNAPGEGTRSIDLKIESLEEAENLAAIGWPIKIYYRGPMLDTSEETKANRNKVRELMKRSCLTFDERRAFLIDRNEYSTEYVDFYIKGIISYKVKEKAPKIYSVIPSRNSIKEMTELNLYTLDGDNGNVKIIKIDVELTPSWNKNRNEYSAYVKEAWVTIDDNMSPFAGDYAGYQLLTNDDPDNIDE